MILSNGRTRSSAPRALTAGATAGLLLTLLSLLLFVACPDVANAADPCGYSPDGRTVICNTDDFRVLLNELARGDERLRLAESREVELQEKLRLLDVALATCRGDVCPTPPPPPDPLWPAVGFGAGVVGTLGLTAALALDMPAEARLTAGGVSLLSLGLGLWLVLPL